MSGVWVFGYGSLVSPESFGHTLGRGFERGVDFHPAVLRGYGRRWNYGVMSFVGRSEEPDGSTREWSIVAHMHFLAIRELPPGLPTVVGDEGKLRQVFMNLVKNAIEAMPRGGRLSIIARVEDGRIIVEVTDTGVGIPEGVDVFEPFKTTKAAGTGLGLSVARQVITSLGGSLGCESELGVGTTFRVVLPIGTEADAQLDA